MAYKVLRYIADTYIMKKNLTYYTVNDGAVMTVANNPLTYAALRRLADKGHNVRIFS